VVLAVVVIVHNCNRNSLAATDPNETRLPNFDDE
jgi:hypothetical protein